MKIGTVLYRESKTGIILQEVVNKVGRLYFECEGDYKGLKYNLNTLKYESKMYSQNNIQLYRTKQEILDLNEHYLLMVKLKNMFGSWQTPKISLEQLRSIHKILEL